MLIPSRTVKNRHNIIIAGDAQAISDLSRFFIQKRIRYHVHGVVLLPGEEGLPVNPEAPLQFRNLGAIVEIPALLEKNSIDELFIVLPAPCFNAAIRELVECCLGMGVVCHIPVTISGYEKYKSILQEWPPFSLRTLYTGSLYQNPSLKVKYCFDFYMSLLLLLLLIPVFMIIALLIVISSGWPVIFVHRRVGYNRRIFNMIKFRTMVKNAEAMQAELESLNEADGAAFKIAGDPRITRFGKWLRKMSLDELPQLVNVLLGDMSLVGPRPLPVRDVSKIEHRWQYRRFSALPGMTCTWQTSRRYEMPFDEWAKLDLEYIDNWSIGIDLKILLRTIPAVLIGKGR
ncbi:MAG TPA: sugar transferase [bacterium]|nr:sugar transferase [bacterium]HPN42150.1 sugar transferase [bacterium]